MNQNSTTKLICNNKKKITDYKKKYNRILPITQLKFAQTLKGKTSELNRTIQQYNKHSNNLKKAP